MKKIALFLFLLISFFNRSKSFDTLLSISKKIHQPDFRISWGITSMLLVQLFNKKSIPGIRIPHYITDITNNIKKKEIERKANKIRCLFKECDFVDKALATFNNYGRGDAFEEKKNNLFDKFNQLRNSEENLYKKIKELYEKKRKIGSLFYKKPIERIVELDKDFINKPDAIEECAINDYLALLLKTIDKAEKAQNNFFYRLFFHNFTEKIKYLLILGEIQLILYCLPFIYEALNRQIED